jgi:pyruvate dehydrogenase E2 component (dihydrolipoamide acetyltransferase)
MIEFKLPSLGADMDEGKLLEWKVKPGDKVKRGDLVAVVETPKAAVDIEVWQDGVVHELITQPGTTIPVGTVMARLLEAGESAPPPTAAAPAPERRPASPAARKRARELDVDIDKLAGTGPHGAVTVEDVEKAAKPAVPVDRAAEMRKAIAAAMSRSKREIPHYYLSETVSLERAAAWLEAENARRPLPERMLMAVLYLKAVALACKAYPDMNGHYVDNAFRPAASVHVGVAISLRQGGLIAPAIHEVEKLPLPELMKKLADLVKRARAGSLRSSEMSDPTITVTNLGEGGVQTVFGIIYPPQVALVGFGSVSRAPAPAVVASLAADHRVSDGHRGALFLAEIARLLQEPEKL